jgi:hypothetical protein
MPDRVWYPAIALPGAPLWGFTYRLLVDWLGVAQRDSATAGFDMAGAVLDFLLHHGLLLRTSWRAETSAEGPVHVATVCGAIPTDAVIERFAGSGPSVPHVNRLEVRPECIRIHGSGFEEYRIEAVAD